MTLALKYAVLVPALILSLLPQKCSRDAAPADAVEWYTGTANPDPSKCDVFYICATEVLSSGDDSPRAHLTEEDKEALRREMSHMEKAFGEEFNFFSPYYHQYTLESISLPEEEFASAWDDVSEELCGAFEEYLEHLNGGRPFILAGFSQGGNGVLDILKSMDDEAYSRLVVAYMMGYRLTGEDLSHPHIKAAEDERSRGVTVSFNSVTTPDQVWPLITDGAAVCTNPLNWTTGSTPATLFFDGDTASVSVDPEACVLVVSGLDSEKYRFPLLDEYVPQGCLHHWDLLFYNDSIRENALLRAYGDAAR